MSFLLRKRSHFYIADTFLRSDDVRCRGVSMQYLRPGFHLQQILRPRRKIQSDYVIEQQSSLPLIALFGLKIGRCVVVEIGFMETRLKDPFQDNCFKRSIRSISPCFDALSNLREYLLELLELSRSIWFSFYRYAFYSCILLRVHSIRTSFILPLLICCNEQRFGSTT